MGTVEFVFVHGISHGAWCWEPLTEALRRRGHVAVAMDLPGHGRRAGEFARASIEAYARTVVAAMALAGVSRGIVVGHSIGGAVVPRVVELAPARVAKIVLMSAVVVGPGASLRETHFTPAMWAMTAGLARASGNGTYRYPAELILGRWLHEIPRRSAAARLAMERFTAQPLRPWVDRRSRHRLVSAVPAVYIRCMQDIAIPPDRQLAYARSLGVEPIDLDAGHDAMLSQPERVADVLLAAAGDSPGSRSH